MARRTKAAELGLLAPREKLLKRLPKLDGRTTPLRLLKYYQVIAEGVLTSVITAAEAEVLNKVASGAQRAIKAHAQGAELRDLEKMHDELQKQIAAVKRHGAEERGKTH